MRKVKVSSVVPPPYVMNDMVSNEEAVNSIITHWRWQLSRVLPDRPDIIVLPEVCDRPAGMSSEKLQDFYRHRGNIIRDVFAEIANKHRCYIVYPAHLEMPDGTWRNSAQFIDRDGKVIGSYHKNHLVMEENTEAGLAHGSDAPIIECDFGTVGCVICFDLNFDSLRCSYAQRQPDMIVFPSLYHGGLMQQYWAYSCRAHFVAAVSGQPSAIISPVGEELASSTNYHPFVTTTINLDCAVIHIDHNHRQFQAIKEKYGERVSIHDPGRLGSVLISSETSEFSIDHVMEAFHLELLDDYLRRSLRHRSNSLSQKGDE